MKLFCLAVACLSVASGAKNTTRRSGRIRVVVGGGGRNSIWRPGSEILEPFRGFGTGGVKVITAAGINPPNDGTNLVRLMGNAGISAEWIPIHNPNCAQTAFDPAIVAMIEEADAIFYGGGQSGRLQSCLYGRYSQNGIEVNSGEMTPVLRALIEKDIVGGSSAGAMNQPMSEILVTGHSVESASAVSNGAVFQRNKGNLMLESEELVDSHFSERGRQGRLMIIAMNTKQKWAFGVDEDAAYNWYPDGTYEIVSEAVVGGIKGGCVIYEDTEGTPEAQSAKMHFLTEGDTINPSTGEIVYNTDKSPCDVTQVPSASNSIFSGTNYRVVSLGVASAAVGSHLDNYHGNPAVQVSFTKTEDTVAMCGVSGKSFANLHVKQFRRAQNGFVNTEEPELPIDYMWEIDGH